MKCINIPRGRGGVKPPPFRDPAAGGRLDPAGWVGGSRVKAALPTVGASP